MRLPKILVLSLGHAQGAQGPGGQGARGVAVPLAAGGGAHAAGAADGAKGDVRDVGAELSQLLLEAAPWRRAVGDDAAGTAEAFDAAAAAALRLLRAQVHGEPGWNIAKK